MPAVGDKAPDFALKDADGRTVKLSHLNGKKIVLYFYPRDLTPGCTKEACGFRDDLKQIEKNNAVVLGVSTDDAETHKRFRSKYDLTFPLLADTDHSIAERYGVWQEKNMYGKKMWGVKRMTFIIDETGCIAHVFGKVKPEGHSQEVIAKLKEIAKG